MDKGEHKGSGAAPPLAAFAVLLVVIVLVAGAAYLLTRSDAEPSPSAAKPQGSPSPTDHRLTDAEAIARFKELDALRIQALEQRSTRLIGQIVIPGSPIGDRVRDTIRDLRRNHVMVDEQWRIHDVSVLQNSLERITVRVVGTSDARFVDEDGNEVPQQALREKRTVICELRYDPRGWRLSECDVEKVVNLEHRKR